MWSISGEGPPHFSIGYTGLGVVGLCTLGVHGGRGYVSWVCQATCVMHCQLCLQRRALKVALFKFSSNNWCSNILDCSWNDMSEFVWMVNSADSIYMYVVEEYVMRLCRYTCVKSYHKVVPHVYIGLYS